MLIISDSFPSECEEKSVVCSCLEVVKTLVFIFRWAAWLQTRDAITLRGAC